jgi:pimeloyl-ACP methyl ester carboxylesterase
MLPGRLVAVDVPGFGASPPVGEGFELDAVADALAGGIGDARFDLVGHSLGGALSIVLAHRQPARVRSLVLVAPAGLRAAPAPVASIAGAVAAVTIPLRRRGAPLADTSWGRRILMGPGTKVPAGLPPAEVRAMLRASEGATRTGAALNAVARVDLRERLGALPMPVGAIWGEHDRIVPATQLPASIQAQRIAGAGHIPMMECPEAFAAALRGLLSRHRNIAATHTP